MKKEITNEKVGLWSRFKSFVRKYDPANVIVDRDGDVIEVFDGHKKKHQLFNNEKFNLNDSVKNWLKKISRISGLISFVKDLGVTEEVLESVICARDYKISVCPKDSKEAITVDFWGSNHLRTMEFGANVTEPLDKKDCFITGNVNIGGQEYYFCVQAKEDVKEREKIKKDKWSRKKMEQIEQIKQYEKKIRNQDAGKTKER